MYASFFILSAELARSSLLSVSEASDTLSLPNLGLLSPLSLSAQGSGRLSFPQAVTQVHCHTDDVTRNEGSVK